MEVEWSGSYLGRGRLNGQPRTLACGAAALLVAWLSASPGAEAQRCTWGGTPSLPPPTATVLRAETDLFHAPGRLAVDTLGNLYATDPETGRVIVRSPYGRLVFVKEGLHHPSAIAVDFLGNIYVAEVDTGSVTAFDPNWNAYLKLGRGDGEFSLPNDIAIDPDPRFDRIYISDGGAHEIKVYASDGAFQYAIGGKGSAPGELDFPAAVHVSAAGELFVADQNNDRIQVFVRDGSFARCFGKTGGMMSFGRKFGRVQGLTGDSLGRLYVADAFQGHVRVFDPQGALLSTIGSFGKGIGELQTPMGLAIDPFNRLWVASVNNSRLEVFGIDDYSDPSALTAHVDIRPDRFKESKPPKHLAAHIELPDVALEAVNLNSVTANGVPALTRWRPRRTERLRHRRRRPDLREPKPSIRFADYDHDGLPDLWAVFDSREVLAQAQQPTDGAYLVVVEGELLDGTPFQGTDTVRSLPPKHKRKKPMLKSEKGRECK